MTIKSIVSLSISTSTRTEDGMNANLVSNVTPFESDGCSAFSSYYSELEKTLFDNVSERVASGLISKFNGKKELKEILISLGDDVSTLSKDFWNVSINLDAKYNNSLYLITIGVIQLSQ